MPPKIATKKAQIDVANPAPIAISSPPFTSFTPNRLANSFIITLLLFAAIRNRPQVFIHFLQGTA
jgi:hypothetical protein